MSTRVQDHLQSEDGPLAGSRQTVERLLAVQGSRTSPDTVIGKQIARLLLVHPNLDVGFRNSDWRSADERTQQRYLVQLQSLLGIRPTPAPEPEHPSDGLQEAIESVMHGANRAMTIDEIVRSLAASGYTVSLSDLRVLVTQKLSRRKQRFSKSNRGVYRLHPERIRDGRRG